MEILLEGKTTEEVFKALELEEHTLYEVKIRSTAHNVEHSSFLFAGYKTGGYCVVYTNNYEYPIQMYSCYSIKIIKKLSKIK